MSSELLVLALQSLAGTTVLDTSHEQKLEAVAKRLQVDAEFRSELRLLTSVWSDVALILSKAVKEGLDPAQVERMLLVFRIVRNGVAGVTENQDQAREANIPNLIQEIVSYAAHTHYGNMSYILMLRAGVQALSNLLTGNNASKDYIWKSLIVKAPSPSCDQNLLREHSAMLFSTSAGRKLLFQLANESHAASGKEERKSFEMIYTLFKHLIGMDYFPELFVSLQDNQEDMEEYEIRYHGENFHKKDEKLSTLEDAQDKGADIKANKGGKQEKKDRSYLSAEQVVLLKMIDSQIYSHHQQQQSSFRQQQAQNGDLLHDTGPPVSQETVAYLTTIFAKLSELTIDVFKTLDQPGIGKHGVEDLTNLSSGMMVLLGCFVYLSLCEDGHVKDSTPDRLYEGVEGEIERPGKLLAVPAWFKSQHMTMVNGGVVENAIRLLQQADVSLARVTKLVTSSSPGRTNTPTPAAPSTAPRSMNANSESTLLSNTSTAQGQGAFFVGLKLDIVQLVGNMSYRSRDVQDRIRNCSGLIVMLSQCNIDDANPFLREYAIVAMRNILETNAENQAIIAELKPIEAVDHPVLQEARVQAHLDTQTGRPVLTQRKAINVKKRIEESSTSTSEVKTDEATSRAPKQQKHYGTNDSHDVKQHIQSTIQGLVKLTTDLIRCGIMATFNYINTIMAEHPSINSGSDNIRTRHVKFQYINDGKHGFFKTLVKGLYHGEDKIRRTGASFDLAVETIKLFKAIPGDKNDELQRIHDSLDNGAPTSYLDANTLSGPSRTNSC
ncbi:hypothetical protein BGZ65_009910 [Modicella reniformis]|uniref:Ataxin-10 homolog n=1 Tax=Modicella reniformis TaxID=1440133 RepID=A0A9P6MKJ9_9FUNG|nr:hypothetical protein BGZ65_009910 [Modicella reniformis]